MKQIVLFLYLTLHACAHAYAQFPGKSAPPRLSALVVGVSEYKHSKINDLEFARRDAEQFARLLGCASNVKVDTIIKLLDEDATVANMDMALKYLKSCIDDTTGRKPKPDYIVLFFSGHGQLSSFDEDQEGYFIMHDTDNASSQDMGYPHRNIVKFIKQRRNKCKFLVISDACHAGRLTGAEEQIKSTTLPVLSELSDIAAVNTGAVFELLSSEGAGQSYEDKSLQHGIFTFYLIKGALGDAEADANKDGLIQNNEIGNYIQAKVNKAEPRQNPVFNSNRGVFLQFDPCMDYSRDKDLASADKRETTSREVRAPKSPVVLKTRFDSLLHYGPLCSEDKNSAYSELKRFKKADPEVYEDMRSRYIVAVLDEDANIMHRYLNQDLAPWKSRFADIEKEIQMQKSLLDLLRNDDFLVQRTSSRYYYFQAMAWYEYSKLVPQTERIARLQKASKLIARSLKIKPDSPTAYFLQSQIYLGLSPGAKAKNRPAQLAETRKRAPEWRLPYLYARDRASLQRYTEMAERQREYNVKPEQAAADTEGGGKKQNIAITPQQPPLPASLTTETGKPVTPEQMAKAFSGNPLLAEDLYLGHALEGKSPEKALKKHRKMAVSAYNLSMKASRISMPPAPDKSPSTTALARLETDNIKADKRVEEEIRYEKQLDTDTVVSEATKARWAELSRIESTPRDTASAKPAGETAGTIPEPEKERADLSGNKPAEPPAKTEINADFFTDQLTGKFVLVKGGTFNMGCTSEQQYCNDYEKPVHPVTLGDYYIAETEVTQAQWKVVMGKNPSSFKDCDDCPVENVSWNDAQEFIARLNARAGSPRYRLPTESEWEYAARGGANSRGYQYAGNNDINEVAWYDDNSGYKTHPVKGKKPNELGVYDMSGNVWEWCSDWYGDYSAASQTNPQGPSAGFYRVNRGGCWGSSAGGCRASYRGGDEPDNRDGSLGFRLAAAIPDTSSQKTGNVPPKNDNKSDDVTGFATGMEERESGNKSQKERTETPVNNSTLPPAAITNGKDSFTDPLLGKFILVKGGTFNMGCTSEQQFCNDDEKPVHPVTLGDYYIAETEVTQAQWKAVMGYNPYGFKDCDDCPVDQVSWNDAQKFITRLNARAGSPRYRLPTEAEWEYAARGGANSRSYQYAGSKDINKVAWYDDNSGDKTHPVKGKKPNELGVYDMSGNVWEWCSDWYGHYSAASQTNPQGPPEGIYRVYRGGSWNYSARYCRASNRNRNEPVSRFNYLGFRLAAAAPR